VLTKGHTWYQDRVVADLDHFLDWIFQPVGHKLSLNPLKYSFKNDDVPKGIVGFGVDLQAQIVSEILEIVLGDDTGAVQVTSQLEGADNPWGRDPLHVQHLHVKLGVVSNDDVVFIVYQIFKFVVDPTSHKGWFVLNHLVGNVVDSHGIDGDRLARIEQITDGRTIIWFEGDLAKPVVCSGSGCLCIEVDVRFLGKPSPAEICTTISSFVSAICEAPIYLTKVRIIVPKMMPMIANILYALSDTFSNSQSSILL
jgi:hypothetical protein